ncbi:MULTISPECIES: hypoxanthine phosphoribosyltransferase [unclassified Motilimonas]|uniref:hypoxanthine phosphoribosyltransferase n=1 Tax=Motilimonas TaxID=1914248 RepID=UPI001E596815|nr:MULTISPECIES: hypoxanthine phosphoribosyltransferase [unclassified Motilimonas]MCE0558682.1 hypoxanthine phosphoribosyltransferase [Motilimonas sp. E26]MDO6525712.1 hypoxanthine phosphoribosyltransferase [Motilimonas sp. 1_MG-2023]
MKHSVEVLISEQDVQQRVSEMAKEIELKYKDTECLVMIGLLRGSCILLADLSRKVNLPVQLDFMTASSYGNKMESSREVKIKKDLDDEIRGKDVLIVEDIIDTGFTLNKIREMLLMRDPASLTICTLLDKPVRRQVEVPVDWVGFSIPDEFVVGYGIDYAQKYRNLPFIGKVVPE